MESWALLSSNLPSVIDRSNLNKFNQSMTRGNLLDNDTQLFIFISILIITQLHPRDPENRQQNRFSERRFSKKKQLQPVEWETAAWLTAVRTCREIIPSSCPLT